ncbi:MAG: chlorosome envelope protein H [Chlorobiaceae bacterium]|jgi:chlorosome envelope protein H|nr:chlorosome envelope protein H [Chlorobiaceae bacterium]
MAAEEIKKTGNSPGQGGSQNAESNAGNGDFANLIGNVGVLLDSTIDTVQGMINSVSSVTGQLIEGVNSTIKSEPLQEIIQNVNTVSGQLIEGVNTVSGQLIEGVNATINSQQVQDFSKMLKNLVENVNSTVNSGQIQNLFNNVSFGLGQLMNNVFMPVMSGGHDEHQKKEVKQIPFCGHAPEPKSLAPAAAPAVKPVSVPVIPAASAPAAKPVQVAPAAVAPAASSPAAQPASKAPVAPAEPGKPAQS